MVRSPDNKPLSTLTDDKLREMAASAAKHYVDYSVKDILSALTYREQRRLARWVAWLIAGTLVTNIIGTGLKVFL